MRPKQTWLPECEIVRCRTKATARVYIYLNIGPSFSSERQFAAKCTAIRFLRGKFLAFLSEHELKGRHTVPFDWLPLPPRAGLHESTRPSAQRRFGRDHPRVSFRGPAAHLGAAVLLLASRQRRGTGTDSRHGINVTCFPDALRRIQKNSIDGKRFTVAYKC